MLSAPLVVGAEAPPTVAPVSCDVLVYGGTPGGIAAALAASRDGARVALIEPTWHLGGLITSGLSHTDFRTYEGAQRLASLICAAGRSLLPGDLWADSEQVKACRRGTQAEPHVNERIFGQMLAQQTNLTVRTAVPVALETGQEIGGGRRRITQITFARPGQTRYEAFVPRVVIDATYEGDLMARRGVAFRVGREARAEYQESLAPEQADTQLQAYNFRLVMTQDPALACRWPSPRVIAATISSGCCRCSRMAGSKRFSTIPRTVCSPSSSPAHPTASTTSTTCLPAPVRLSLPGENLAWPEGDAAVGSRLTAAARASTTVARIGGDEFAVICENADEDAVRVVAERVQAALADPVVLSYGEPRPAGQREHRRRAVAAVRRGGPAARGRRRDVRRQAARRRAHGAGAGPGGPGRAPGRRLAGRALRRRAGPERLHERAGGASPAPGRSRRSTASPGRWCSRAPGAAGTARWSPRPRRPRSPRPRGRGPRSRS